MLLKALHDFAISRKLLDDLAFERDKPVRYAIQLTSEGECLGVMDTAGTDQKKGRLLDIPKTSRPAGTGMVADFLVDDISAIFGVNIKDREMNKSEQAKLTAKHGDFWRQIEEAADNPSLTALIIPILKFRASLSGGLPGFLTQIEKVGRTETKKVWQVGTLSGPQEWKNEAFTFEVDGDLILNNEDIRAHWAQRFQAEAVSSESSAARGTCLITGQTGVALARTHSPIPSGFPAPARPTGAGFVSGEGEAFLSYGFDRALNAPTSIAASKAYLRALSYMAGHADHFYRTGPTWLMFWTGQTRFRLAELIGRPTAKDITAFMKSPWSGIERPPPATEKFTAMTLTAAGPRLIVKDWLQVPLVDATANLQRWFTDLRIEPVSYLSAPTDDEREPAPYSIYNLAKMTVRPSSDGRYTNKETDKVDTAVPAALYAAALKGAPPPIALLKPLLDRLRARMAKDGKAALYEHSRFALIKLILNRNPDPANRMTIEPQIADTNDQAYNCGRLLSIFSNLQRRAHSSGTGKEASKLNTTLAERYFASASSTPNSAFGIIWRLHQAHLKKLRQGGEKGESAAGAFRTAIANVCAKFTAAGPNQAPMFKRVFTLQEQSRFALGFYQQEAARASAFRAWKAKQTVASTTNTDPDAEEHEAPAEVELAVTE